MVLNTFLTLQVSKLKLQFSSVQFSHSVVSNSLRPHESQHARPPCPSPTPGVHPNHVHWVGDAIQPSHPLSSPSPSQFILQFSSVQSLSCVRLFATPWIAARQVSLSITNSQSSLRLTSIEPVMPSSHLILCRPLLLHYLEISKSLLWVWPQCYVMRLSQGFIRW